MMIKSQRTFSILLFAISSLFFTRLSIAGLSLTEPNGVSDNTVTAYMILWSDTNYNNQPVLSLYYDTTNTGYHGVLIASNVIDSSLSSFKWDITSVPTGAYYIYIVKNNGDGTFEKAYSPGKVTVAHFPEGLILWNRMESIGQVTHSQIGPEGVIYGTPVFKPCEFSNGFYSGDNSSYVVFMLPVLNAFTFEWWFRTDWNCINGTCDDDVYSHAWFTWIHENYTKITFETYHRSIWGMFFGVINAINAGGSGYGLTIPDSDNFNWSANTAHHFAISYDRNGINNSSDKVRFYLDGVLTSAITDTPPLMPDTDYSLLMMNFNDYNRTFGGVMEDVKLWNYAKSDFSDRSVEGIPQLVILSPTNNSVITDITPSFTWQVPPAFSTNGIQFKIEIADNAGFLNETVYESRDIATGFDPEPPVVPGKGSEFFSMLNNLKANTTYYWRVSGYDGVDYYISSDVWQFRIK